MSQKLREENKRLKAELKVANWKIKTLNDSISSTISFINGIREADGGVK